MFNTSIFKNMYFWIVISFIIVIPIILYLIFKKSNVKCDSTNCDPTGGSCDSTGKCNCKTGYYGPNCRLKCDSTNCGSTGGSCDSSTGKCNCKTGYYGPNCIVKCDTSNCDPTGGSCDSTGKCNCKTGYYGPNCRLKCDSTNCGSTGGSCDSSTGKCNCKTGYYGPNCIVKCDTSNCDLTGGSCDSKGTCICKPSYYGPKCDEKFLVGDKISLSNLSVPDKYLGMCYSCYGFMSNYMAVIGPKVGDFYIFTIVNISGDAQSDIVLVNTSYPAGVYLLNICMKCIGYTGGEYLVTFQHTPVSVSTTWTLSYKKPGVYSLKNKATNTYLGVCNGCFGKNGPPMPVNVESASDSDITTHWNITKI